MLAFRLGCADVSTTLFVWGLLDVTLVFGAVSLTDTESSWIPLRLAINDPIGEGIPIPLIRSESTTDDSKCLLALQTGSPASLFGLCWMFGFRFGMAFAVVWVVVVVTLP